MVFKKVLKTRVSFIAVLLLVFLLAIPVGSSNLVFLEHSSAISDYEHYQLGTLSQIYESNNNPGAISSGNGDWGGVSYGAYQFASNFNVPYLFVQWMVDEHSSYYDRLVTAYRNDGNTYGRGFNEEWQAIAKEDSATFLKLQHKYIKHNYYDKTVRKLKRDIGFDVSNYSIALKNTIWSRSVQHGWSGGANVIINAYSSIDIENVSEKELIKAIYLESGMKLDQPPYSNSIKMGDGRYMKYFSRNSAAVQQSVWNRLNINELNDALEMLEDEAADDKLEPEPEPESEPNPEPTVIVNVDVLRLRAGPSTNHQILARLTKNTILEVIGSENEWLKVITPDGKEGWVHGDYVMNHTDIGREENALAKKPFSDEEFGLESIGLEPGISVEDIVAILGNPVSVEFEENGHLGDTKCLYYDGLMLGCNSNSLWFFEITTPDIISKRGIRVGDSAESVINKYLVKNMKEFVCCGNAWNCVELYYIDIGDDTAMGGGYHRDQHTGEITSIYYWYGVPGSCAGTSVEYIIDNGVVKTIDRY